MKKIILSFVLSCFLSINLFAQTKLSKNDEAEITAVCQKFVLLENQIADSVHNFTFSRYDEIAIPKFRTYKEKRYTYYNLMGYNLIFPEYKFERIINNDTVLGCQYIRDFSNSPHYNQSFNEENKLQWVNLKKVGGDFKIIGYNNRKITSEMFEALNRDIDSAKIIYKNRQKIENSVRLFYEGLNDLYLKNDKSKLEKMTSKIFLETCILEKRLDSLREIRFRKYEIKEFDYTQYENDSAETRVELKKDNEYIYLKLIDSTWIVYNMRWGKFNPDHLEKIKRNINEFEKKIKVFKVLNQFEENSSAFFLNDDETKFKEILDEKFLEELKLFKTKFGTYNKKNLKIGLEKRKHSDDYNLEIEDNKAFYEIHRYSGKYKLIFEKLNGEWKILGLIDCKNVKSKINICLERNFKLLKTYFEISYDSRKTDEDSMLGSEVDEDIIPMTEVDEDTYIDSGNYDYEELEEDSNIYNCLDDIRTFPKFLGGYDALLSYVEKNLTVPKNNQEGYILIEFVIEKNGAITNVQNITQKPYSESFANEAIKLVKNMPNWIPAIHYGRIVRSKYVLPIYFNGKN